MTRVINRSDNWLVFWMTSLAFVWFKNCVGQIGDLSYRPGAASRFSHRYRLTIE